MNLMLLSLLFSAQQISAKQPIKQSTHLQKVVKTAKERLGKKYADEQRVNNCKVPIDKRGSKPRPGQCHWATHH